MSHGAVAEKVYLPRRRGRGSPRRRGSDEPRRRGRESLVATAPWQGVATPAWQQIATTLWQIKFSCHGAVAGCRYAGVAAMSHGAVAEKIYLPRRRGRG